MGDYLFNAEYAKSGRAGCRGCKMNIEKDTLRLAVMVQSPHFDGRVPMWYHYTCFWRQPSSKKIKSETDIHHFDNLRWDDQELIRSQLSGTQSAATASKTTSPRVNAQATDFKLEYAKNSAAKCRDCDAKVLKGEIRIGHHQKATQWYHLSCFAGKKNEFGFTFSPENVPGFEMLDDADKEMVLQKLKDLKRALPTEENGGSTKPKKRKPANEAMPAEEAEKLALKKQSENLWKLRDQLNSSLKKKEWSELLTYNDQEIPSGEAKILDRLTDCMLFGALEKCPECKTGQLAFSSTHNAYVCTGHISGFTSCQYSTTSPKRRAFEVPEGFEDIDFLANYKVKPGRQRILPSSRPSLTLNGSFSSGGTATTSAPSKPFLQMKFAVLPDVSKDAIETIRSNGGSIVPKVDANVVALLAPKGTGPFTVPFPTSTGKSVALAKTLNVHVVSEEFVDDAKKGNISDAIEKHKLCDWGSEINARIQKSRLSTVAPKSGALKSDAQFTKSVPVSRKLLVKGGAAVDPDFEHGDVAHVYQDKNKDVYNAVLGSADVLSGRNSYYKLQIYEHDTSKKYWLFRSWGRTGTTIGGTKTDSFASDLDSAKEEFKRLYLEKTGNHWHERHNFEKKPRLMYPLEIDYGQDEEVSKSKVAVGSKSKLPTPVQDLIKMIFDIEQMKQTMKEFEIDLKKMPLGKLSKKHIQEAYKILTELQETLQSDKNQTKILDCSNRFFTLIPHDFGLEKPPLLDNTDIVKSKTEMLDNLLEIEIAYGILKADTGDEDPLDAHYAKLQTDLRVLDKNSDEFKMIQEYVKNTHAATHNLYDLEVEEVFVTNRHGEYDRYSEFKDLHNRMLLWHGSRTSNYVGILSQGLRIAPPEAPMTGYMFGKGIYFADMVSKSANYCYTGKTNPVGLIMLSEVALGNMQEYTNAFNVTKLPPGKHSVKGLGQTMPDPKGYKTLENGTVVPMGPGVPANTGKTSLLYNEYIVYNVAQVNIKYLIKLRFNYKY